MCIYIYIYIYTCLCHRQTRVKGCFGTFASAGCAKSSLALSRSLQKAHTNTHSHTPSLSFSLCRILALPLFCPTFPLPFRRRYACSIFWRPLRAAFLQIFCGLRTTFSRSLTVSEVCCFQHDCKCSDSLHGVALPTGSCRTLAVPAHRWPGVGPGREPRLARASSMLLLLPGVSPKPTATQSDFP